MPLKSPNRSSVGGDSPQKNAADSAGAEDYGEEADQFYDDFG